MVEIVRRFVKRIPFEIVKGRAQRDEVWMTRLDNGMKG
jgi:hypothetical protein